MKNKIVKLLLRTSAIEVLKMVKPLFKIAAFAKL